ncbi:hypothetical protein [[Clostridium] aminophilum]|nr:hypothetical protein [[Clostridium] aminophilum]
MERKNRILSGLLTAAALLGTAVILLIVSNQDPMHLLEMPSYYPSAEYTLNVFVFMIVTVFGMVAALFAWYRISRGQIEREREQEKTIRQQEILDDMTVEHMFQESVTEQYRVRVEQRGKQKQVVLMDPNATETAGGRALDAGAYDLTAEDGTETAETEAAETEETEDADKS